MQLFYAPDIVPPDYTLPEEESRHCVRVLRMGNGDTVNLTDGAGNMFLARIEDADPRSCRVRVVETYAEYGRRGYRLTLAVAPTKNPDRYEWFLEKATEAGVDRIIPVECEHSERRTIKTERCRKVVASAMKQSLKAYMPQVDELTPFDKVVAMPFEGRRLIAHCEEGCQRRFIGDCLGKGEDVLILIGPEGDFSQREISLARENGFVEMSLGESRYRTETAAVASAVMVSYINTCSSK